MSFQIVGLATATPMHSISQRNAIEVAKSICSDHPRHSRALSALYRRAGVQRRYSVTLESGDETATISSSQPCASAQPQASSCVAERTQIANCVQQSFFPPAISADDCGPTTSERMELYEQHACLLAVDAARKALRRSGMQAEHITHLITISCTGFSAPGIDLSIIRDCGLRPGVARTQIGFMGCHAAINGLRIAKAIAESDPSARILLCAVELCTLHQQYGWHPERVVSNALFGDGAAAIVGWAGDANDQPHPAVVATGSTIVPDTTEQMSWKVRDHGFEMTLSSQVPGIIETSLQAWLSDWLNGQQLDIREVRGWAIHPGGPKIVRACAQSLGLVQPDIEAAQSILAEFGNMSSPTVLFILERLIHAGQASPCVMLAFGPGLSIEAALIR